MNDPVALTPIWGAMGDFNSTNFNCSLGDVEFDGPPYTWTNGRVWQRLDRALVNEAWSRTFGVTKVSHLVRGRSDHVPLLIRCGQMTGQGSAFRFLNIWGKHPIFLEVVQEAWREPVQLGGMHGFFRRLANTKAKLRQWNPQCFGNISQAVQRAEERLRQCESEFQLRRDEVLRTKLGEARAAFTRVLAIEGEF